MMKLIIVIDVKLLGFYCICIIYDNLIYFELKKIV